MNLSGRESLHSLPTLPCFLLLQLLPYTSAQDMPNSCSVIFNGSLFPGNSGYFLDMTFHATHHLTPATFLALSSSILLCAPNSSQTELCISLHLYACAQLYPLPGLPFSPLLSVEILCLLHRTGRIPSPS